MDENSQPSEQSRKAIIIGINKYKEPGIPELKGAENDAECIYKRLNDKEIGNFDIIAKLVGSDATCKNIREAMSDLFWQTDPCELALFYFSGHGFSDNYGNGYLAPWDMEKESPIVNGINMDEVKELMLRSKNKQSAILLIDCCYSGIPTKGEKSPAVNTFSFNDYVKSINFEKGRGKYIYSSSGPEQKSREDCLHHKDDESRKMVEHSHGIFTYHLINALDGNAADPNNGIITFDGIKNYVDEQLKGVDQQPNAFMVDVNKNILIALEPIVYEKYTTDLIDNAKQHYETFVGNKDPVSLLSAARVINKSSGSKFMEKRVRIIEDINSNLRDFSEKTTNWLFDNSVSISEIDANIPRLIERLEEIVRNSLTCEGIRSLNEREFRLLADLCKAGMGNDKDRNKLIEDMLKFVRPPKSNLVLPAPTTAQPVAKLTPTHNLLSNSDERSISSAPITRSGGGG